MRFFDLWDDSDGELIVDLIGAIGDLLYLSGGLRRDEVRADLSVSQFLRSSNVP